MRADKKDDPVAKIAFAREHTRKKLRPVYKRGAVSIAQRRKERNKGERWSPTGERETWAQWHIAWPHEEGTERAQVAAGDGHMGLFLKVAQAVSMEWGSLS